MTFVRLIVAFLILLSATFFLMSNIEHLEDGGGYQFLALTVGLSLILLILSDRWYIVTQVKASQLLLLFFLVYFVANLIFDTGNISLVRAATTGTTGGVVFALVLGYLLSFAISDIYLGMGKKQYVIGSASFLIVLYMTIVLFMIGQAFLFHLSGVRSDLFLIADQEGLYQRPANFILIQFIVNSALIALFYAYINEANKILFVMAFVLYTLTALIFMLLAQLIGSNSGMASVAGFFMMMLVFLYVARLPGLKEGSMRIGLKSIMFGWIGRRVIIGAGVSLLVSVLGFIYLISATGIDTALFRITGFGSGENSSVNSRAQLIINNFIEQLSYSPIFGNTQVDSLTTGAGTYVHSLLSVMTHLGIIGSLIFCIFMVQVYIELTRKNVIYGTLYTDLVYDLFRLFSLGIVLIFALLTAFYTWLPLWFTIGFLGFGLCKVGGDKCGNV